MKNNFRLSFCVLLISLFSSACSEYWWTRGQPPAVSTLLKRQQETLEASLDQYAEQRPALAKSSKEVQLKLLAILESGAKGQTQSLPEQFSALVGIFHSLEAEVSFGSRAAISELSGQLRAFSTAAAASGSPAAEMRLDPEAFGLFSARTFAFLANELKVSAPSVL